MEHMLNLINMVIKLYTRLTRHQTPTKKLMLMGVVNLNWERG